MSQWLNGLLFFGLCTVGALSQASLHVSQPGPASFQAKDVPAMHTPFVLAENSTTLEELELKLGDQNKKAEELQKQNTNLKDELTTKQKDLNAKETALDEKDQQIQKLKEEIKKSQEM